MPQAEKPNTMSRLTRRSALAGLAGAAAAGVAAVPAIASVGADAAAGSASTVVPAIPSPDAALLLLVDEYLTASTEAQRLDKIISRAYKKMWAENPMPEALRVRPEDRELGIPNWHQMIRAAGDIIGDPPNNSALDGTYELRMCIDTLRAPKWKRVVEIDPPDGKRFFYCGGRVGTEEFEPSPAARARADEIVRAYDDWHPRQNAVPRGIGKLQREARRFWNRTYRLERKIARTRARSFAGILAKAKVANAYYPDDDTEGANLIAASIARDVLQIDRMMSATAADLGKVLS